MFLFKSVSAQSPYPVLRVQNNTNCPFIVAVELRDQNTYTSCNNVVYLSTALPILAGVSGYTDVDFDGMGYLPSYAWIGGDTYVVRCKVAYDASILPACNGGDDVGICSNNGNGPVTINVTTGCGCNNGNPVTVTLSIVPNTPFNFDLLTIN